MNGKRGLSLEGRAEGELIPKLRRPEAIMNGKFHHEDWEAIEDYEKWTKDALVLEVMSVKHEILELRQKYEAECNKTRLAREATKEAKLTTKRAVWTARVMQSRLKFLLMGKPGWESLLGCFESNAEDSCQMMMEYSSCRSSGEVKEGEGVHDSCPTCRCKSDGQNVQRDNRPSQLPEEESLVLRLEYNLGVMLEDFQRKFKVILSDTRKLYAKSEPLGVSKVVWLKAARRTMAEIGDAEEVLLASGEKVFITRDDHSNWGPEQRFDNLFRFAKYIVGGSRYLDLLRVASLEQFMDLEAAYFPQHDDVDLVGSGGLEANPIRGMWRSELWNRLVKSLLRIALPAAKNAECLQKVYKNLSHVQIHSPPS